MIESLLPLLLILAGFYVWQGALRARELARTLSRELCAEAHVQLLDQTVALHKMRLVREQGHGLLPRRDYGFEFSVDGKDRHRGLLSVIDGRLLAHNMSLAAPPAIEAAGNVVPLPPPGSRRH